MSNQIILNEDQEKVVSAAVRFLNTDGPQVFQFTGSAGT